MSACEWRPDTATVPPTWHMAKEREHPLIKAKPSRREVEDVPLQPDDYILAMGHGDQTGEMLISLNILRECDRHDQHYRLLLLHVCA